jgi:hypothetical protein
MKFQIRVQKVNRGIQTAVSHLSVIRYLDFIEKWRIWMPFSCSVCLLPVKLIAAARAVLLSTLWFEPSENGENSLIE